MRSRVQSHLISVFLITFFSISAASQTPELVINVLSASGDAVGAPLINGYASTVSGTVMQYHSAHPDAEMALIVRARRDVHSISWKTEPLPADAPGNMYHLVWLAGLEHAGWTEDKVPHTFHLAINGEPWFTFKNAKDDSAREWTVAGRDGAQLRFRSTKADVFGDLFGYMFLDLPRRDFLPGAPLQIEVTGEDSDSLDWYMTFQHRFEGVPRLRTEPVLLNTHGTPAQMLRVSLDNLAEGRAIEIQAPNQQLIRSPLAVGGNVFQVPVPAVTADQPLKVAYQVDGTAVERFTVTLKPVRRRDIYLVSYSHNDIGYTDLQADVEHKQWRNLDQALDLIRRTRDYPADSRYKWNMEVIWALDTYLRNATPARRAEVLAAIRDGSLGVNALYANILTGLANSVEMEHFLDYARSLRNQDGINVTTALTSDVPGWTWGIVSALAHSGVRYFAMAPNNGDRIGHTLEVWGDKPFYWVSQSGQERVLAWVAGASYSSFHEGTLAKLGDDKMLKLVRHWDEIDYPYDIVQLPYTQGDNGPPDPTLPDFVKSWNQRYSTPRLIIATHAQMFRDFEKRYGAQLPTVRGDFTPYWEDGAASTAYETALARHAVDRLIDGEVLWSILAPQAFPASSYAEAWRNAVLWDEHTWGADKSVSDPDLPFVTKQWEFKKQFAERTDAEARSLIAKLLPPKAPGKAGVGSPAESAIDIYNTTSWERTDLVLLSPDQSRAGDRVVDKHGKPLRSQRLSTGELAVLAENVPPFSALRVVVRSGRSHDEGAAHVGDNTLHNGIVSVAIDPHTGAIAKLQSTADQAEFVDTSRSSGLNQYEYVLGRDPAAAKTLSEVSVSVKEHGGLIASLLVTAKAPGQNQYASEVRVIDGLGRVDIINSMDKQKVREKEGAHFAFPFLVKDGLVRYDVADSIVRAEADQIAGSCKNFVSAQSWVDVSNATRGITLATPDAPLAEIGAINAEQGWMTTTPASQLVFSYVMNNYWHTNYKADQEGPAVFRYSLMPHGAFDPSVATRFGLEQRHPLLAFSAITTKPPAASLFQLESAFINALSVTPLPGGHSWLLYLQNTSSAAQTAQLRWNSSAAVTVRRSDPSGAGGVPIPGVLDLPAYGTAYVRVDGRSH